MAQSVSLRSRPLRISSAGSPEPTHFLPGKPLELATGKLLIQQRSVCFDVENRPLAYWFDDRTSAEITAIGWLWSDENVVRTLMLLPDGYFLADDGVMMPAGMAYTIFRNVLCEADLVFGHNIRRHDLPLFQAGLLRQQLPPLPSILTTDTCKDIPKRKEMSASLENLAALYKLPGKKLVMAQAEWEDANRLTDTGIALSRKRVAEDVLLQDRLRNKLAELKILRPPRVWKP
jgi:hypothetical protein